jgi:hypothetical protein
MQAQIENLREIEQGNSEVGYIFATGDTKNRVKNMH